MGQGRTGGWASGGWASAGRRQHACAQQRMGNARRIEHTALRQASTERGGGGGRQHSVMIIRQVHARGARCYCQQVDPHLCNGAHIGGVWALQHAGPHAAAAARVRGHARAGHVDDGQKQLDDGVAGQRDRVLPPALQGGGRGGWRACQPTSQWLLMQVWRTAHCCLGWCGGWGGVGGGGGGEPLRRLAVRQGLHTCIRGALHTASPASTVSAVSSSTPTHCRHSSR